MDEEETELRNPFPSPPSHYTRYTNHNLKLLELLKERAGDGADVAALNQYDVLSDQTNVPEWSIATLDKPRVDWILEEGHYTVFGDTWFVSGLRDISFPSDWIHRGFPGQGDYPFISGTWRTSAIPTGSQRRYVPHPPTYMCSFIHPLEPLAWADRRPALRSILRSLLVTYSKLLSSLLAPPPTNSSEGEAEWKQHLEWINILAQNIMAAANDLRPVQARGNLELMMRRQLELRREETKAIHSYVYYRAVFRHGAEAGV